MAPLFPFLFLFITVAFGEFVLTRHLHASLTSQLSAFLYVVIDSLLSYWVSLLFTEVLKTHVGVLRPDFLQRCDPDTTSFKGAFVPTIGSTAVPACRSPPSAKLTDGHYSFPSGHASASANFEFYLITYFLWTCFHRRFFVSGDNLEALMAASRSGGRAFLRDVGEGLAVLWILFNLGVTWAISATRVTDNRHHVADVVAGMFLGGTIATVFALRAIPRVRGIMEVAGPGIRKAADDNHDAPPLEAVV
ncbi:hypothetical protein WJX81_007442 [Elliptochloris bilobata]|uniref:Phosphatidic acid phosphatase type 2/haloperoxidase domain-containing protein n=1 Tax=Elliptochloris bilobata TaxID=381761 RepID=A0AAW1R143_9CHLO